MASAFMSLSCAAAICTEQPRTWPCRKSMLAIRHATSRVPRRASVSTAAVRVVSDSMSLSMRFVSASSRHRSLPWTNRGSRASMVSRRTTTAECWQLWCSRASTRGVSASSAGRLTSASARAAAARDSWHSVSSACRDLFKSLIWVLTACISSLEAAGAPALPAAPLVARRSRRSATSEVMLQRMAASSSDKRLSTALARSTALPTSSSLRLRASAAAPKLDARSLARATSSLARSAFIASRLARRGSTSTEAWGTSASRRSVAMVVSVAVWKSSSCVHMACKAFRSTLTSMLRVSRSSTRFCAS
mmetsp:Transcript_57738/g.148527  ORF Transcript_57738/g.148527 Transcript_57738/m.148527 type:complete len:305 (-) Transcript_57738:145-1059(-)